jgi:hypothetical protein
LKRSHGVLGSTTLALTALLLASCSSAPGATVTSTAAPHPTATTATTTATTPITSRAGLEQLIDAAAPGTTWRAVSAGVQGLGATSVVTLTGDPVTEETATAILGNDQRDEEAGALFGALLANLGGGASSWAVPLIEAAVSSPGGLTTQQREFRGGLVSLLGDGPSDSITVDIKTSVIG